MVERLRKVLAILERDKGQVSLFAILKMDDLSDVWTLVVSATWINSEQAAGQAFYDVLALLNKYLTLEDLQMIARLNIYTTDEHLVQDMLKYKKGTHITEATKINGNIAFEAYIFESRSPKGNGLLKAPISN